MRIYDCRLWDLGLESKKVRGHGRQVAGQVGKRERGVRKKGCRYWG